MIFFIEFVTFFNGASEVKFKINIFFSDITYKHDYFILG
jgi:hypothetical protein